MVVGAVRAGVAVLALLAPPAAGHTAAVAGPARQPAPPDEPLSLLVATEGRPSTEAAYPFVVGEGASISGKLRFLSQEYPTYYLSLIHI